MKKVSPIFTLVVIALIFNACVKNDFPVPPASTVSKFTFTVDNDKYAPATVTFTNTSIVPTTVGNAFYSWSFGDGTKSTDKDPVHIYNSPGSYEVILTIKTTISQETRIYSENIVILNPNASGIYTYFTDGNLVYSGFLNDDAPAFTALPIGPFDASYGMTIDTLNSKLYISDSGTGKIYRYDTETGVLITFRSGLAGPDGLAIDFKTGKLYWDTDDGIQRTNLSSTTETEVEDFVTGQTNDPEGVSIDPVNDKLYWVCYDGGLWSINLDGTAKTQLSATPEGGSTLVVGNKLFFDQWIATGDIHIKSSDLDGSNIGTITTGISKLIFGITYEPTTNKIYWGNRSAGTIMRANLDGSGVETWFKKNESSPRGVCFGKKK